ncbi:hypothetical protein JIQ42_07378 [Leishmania sp. Namibia]|uniref:hypothetical protein n=1 Tax=Leishmania sp. Namibia TaxID=2802991 RepID=UPI001B639095|nr:hypothetical protein JIQ42_07378 [Leishmania sp. Namibia]
MPSSKVHADTKAMVVVVDVFNSLAQQTLSPPAKASVLGRFEIDVDVVPHSTTADMLLADVAGALQEMQLVMCAPLQTAALAPGNVLPSLALIQKAIGVHANNGSDRRQGSLILSVGDSYAAAVQHALDSVDTRQMPTAAPPLLSSLALRIGNDYVVEERAGHLSPSNVIWSVVPQLIEAASSITSKAAAHAASPSTSFRRVLTQNPASAGATAESDRAPHVPLAALPSLSRDSAPMTTNAFSRASSGAILSGSEATTASFAVNRATADVSRNERSPKSSLAVGSTVPSPSPSLLGAQQQSTAPVVALEDVDVVAFRRLQARQVQLLACGAKRHDDLLDVSGLAAAPAEEQRRPQPTLPWAADAAAAQVGLELLQAEHALNDDQGGVGAAVATRAGAGESLDEAGCGDSQRGAGRWRWGVGVASDRSSQPQLRVQWLAAVRAKIHAYRRETAALRRATEKARQRRESMKEHLREEIAQLEAEEAQRSAALAERDVLRCRVLRLEAQVAAAKAAEMALLARQESANVLPPASEKGQRASGGLRAARRSAESHQQHVTAVVTKPALEPFIDTPASELRDSSKHSPPLSQAYRSAPPASGGYGCGSNGVHRWSGRRVPLTTHCDTIAAPPKSTALELPAAQQWPSRSRSRLAIERSFLSPSLQAEVWAALASDDDADSSITASHSDSTVSAEARGGGGRTFDVTAEKGVEEALLSPAERMRRRRQRSTVTASRIAANVSPEPLNAPRMTRSAAALTAAAAAEAPPFRTAVTTASSLSTAVPSATSPHSNQQV